MTRHIGDHRATLLAAAELVDSIAAQAARESELYAMVFRTRYGQGYAIGHAHGYDVAQAEAPAEWAAHAAHMRQLRDASGPGVDEARMSAAVDAAERLVRAMARRHWEAFTALQTREHPHGVHRRGRSA